MNERIRELMADAGFDPASIERMGIMPNAQKFAQLIIIECAVIVAECRRDDEVSDGEYIEVEAKEMILQHFGLFGLTRQKS